MIEPQIWLAEASAGLKKVFKARLLYLGLQGSYRRGEATEDSDIDLVTILDEVSLNDLDNYRQVVRALPEGEKACGFICGQREFRHWPRHELFPFKMDTTDYHGRLDDFMPPVSRDDIREGVRIGASALLHQLSHSYLYAAPGEKAGILKETYKGAFFVIRVLAYLLTGHFQGRRSELLNSLADPEKTIVAAGLDFPAWLAENSEQEAYRLLMDWSRETLTRPII